jgi:hypothetical protein
MTNTLSYIIPFGLLAVFMGTALIFVLKLQKRLILVTTGYANAHGWSYNTKPPIVPLFQRLYRYRTHDKTLIEGTLEEHRFWLYLFWWGGARQTHVYELSIELPFEVPNAVILVKGTSELVNSLESINDVMVKQNLHLSPVLLDSSVSEKFTLLTDQGQEEAVRKYITPDFLTALDQHTNSKAGSQVTLSGNFLSINAGLVAAYKNNQSLDDLFAEAKALLKTLSVK